MDTTIALLADTDWFPLMLSLKVATVATVLALVAGVTIRIHNDLTGHPRLVDQVLRWAIRLSRRR